MNAGCARIVLGVSIFCFSISSLTAANNQGVYVSPDVKVTCGSNAKLYGGDDVAYNTSGEFCHACYKGGIPYVNYCTSWTPSPIPSFPTEGGSVTWKCGSETCTARRLKRENGVCGTANKTYPYSSQSFVGDTLCASGVRGGLPGFPAPGSSVTWVCAGINGGTTATCTASRLNPPPVNGSCGKNAREHPQDWSYYAYDFCALGTPPNPSPYFPQPGETITWVCRGKYGGKDTTCIATRVLNGVCGSRASIYNANDVSYGGGSFCRYGNPSPSNPAFPGINQTVNWTCVGELGGKNATCSASRKPTPINGVCGSANKTYPYTSSNYGSDTFCSAGITPNLPPTFPKPGGSTEWKCAGVDGGGDIYCKAYLDTPPKINGTCGSANKTYPSTATSFGSDTFCTAGNSPNPSPAFPGLGQRTSWECRGQNGGSTEICYALHQEPLINGVCGSANRIYGQNENSFGSDTFCNSGDVSANPSFPPLGGNVKWTCNGKGGGVSAGCTAVRIAPINGVCGTANKTYPSTATSFGSDTFCATGTPPNPSPAFPSIGSRVNWTCEGKNGGSNISCGAVRTEATIEGSCGIAGGFYTYDSLDFRTPFCRVGTLSGALPVFPAQGSIASWTCEGRDKSVTCTATRGSKVDRFPCGDAYGGTRNEEPKTGLCSPNTSLIESPRLTVCFSPSPEDAIGCWLWVCREPNSTVGTVCHAYKKMTLTGSVCGDGIVTPSQGNVPGEVCDPKDPNKTKWGNAGCDPNTCLPLEIKVNGACGSANRVYSGSITTFGSDTFCTAGNTPNPPPSFPNIGSRVSWVCSGTGGGTNAGCAASRDGSGTLCTKTSTFSHYTCFATGGTLQIDFDLSCGVQQKNETLQFSLNHAGLVEVPSYIARGENYHIPGCGCPAALTGSIYTFSGRASDPLYGAPLYLYPTGSGVPLSCGASCGNGIREGTEECDLGSQNGGAQASCDSLCKKTGNDISEPLCSTTIQGYLDTPIFEGYCDIGKEEDFQDVFDDVFHTYSWKCRGTLSGTMNNTGAIEPSCVASLPCESGYIALQGTDGCFSCVSFSGSSCTLPVLPSSIVQKRITGKSGFPLSYGIFREGGNGGFMDFNVTPIVGSPSLAYTGVNEIDNTIIGWFWIQSIGWVNFGNCAPVRLVPQGGELTGWSLLSGYAWNENAGWIEFQNTAPGTKVFYNSGTQFFSGFAWNDGIGWIDFRTSIRTQFCKSESCPAGIIPLVTGTGSDGCPIYACTCGNGSIDASEECDPKDSMKVGWGLRGCDIRCKSIIGNGKEIGCTAKYSPYCTGPNCSVCFGPNCKACEGPDCITCTGDDCRPCQVANCGKCYEMDCICTGDDCIKSAPGENPGCYGFLEVDRGGLWQRGGVMYDTLQTYRVNHTCTGGVMTLSGTPFAENGSVKNSDVSDFPDTGEFTAEIGKVGNDPQDKPTLKTYVTYTYPDSKSQYITQLGDPPLSPLSISHWGVRVIGSIGEATNTYTFLQNSMNKNVAETTRGLKEGVVVNGIVYYTGDRSYSSITSTNTAFETVIVYGNLTLDRNIPVTKGIIVLRDGIGNGGNIIVDDAVTDIHAIIFAEGILRGESTKASQINGPDQLVLQGALYSRNTIGGSMDPNNLYIYPNIKINDRDIAFMYDLDNVRGGNRDNTKYLGYSDPFIIHYDPEIIQNPPPGFYR